jgi:TolA-binding protein
MRLVLASALAVIAALAFAPIARAQESDEEIKRRILSKVRERLAEEKKQILERMAKVIDEELSGAPKKEPAPGEAKPVDKRIRDLERQIQQLDDKRDDLRRDIRAIKRETEDAKIIEQAKRSPPQSDEEYTGDFNEAMGYHTAKEFDKSIEGFKRLAYAFKDHSNKDVVKQAASTPAYNVACGYALKGDKEQAIDWLDLSIKLGFDQWDHIRTDSDFDSIRKERRFLRLLADR